MKILLSLPGTIDEKLPDFKPSLTRVFADEDNVILDQPRGAMLFSLSEVKLLAEALNTWLGEKK